MWSTRRESYEKKPGALRETKGCQESSRSIIPCTIARALEGTVLFVTTLPMKKVYENPKTLASNNDKTNMLIRQPIHSFTHRERESNNTIDTRTHDEEERVEH